MRRYLISHFREPVDIASSSLGEKHAVYGGGPNLKQGLRNVIAKYHPQVIGVATTCLTETIGDDVPHLLKEFRAEASEAGIEVPEIVAVSTPSYAGTHMEGFHVAVRGLVEHLAEAGPPTDAVNLLPGFVSPADLRHLKELLADFGLPAVVLPDYSETLDGPALDEYPLIPEGGTPLTAIRGMGGAAATLELGRTLGGGKTAGALLTERFGVPLRRLGMPIGLRESDRFFAVLGELSGRPIPRLHALERGRLVDAYVDGHKVVFGKKAVIYGEEDLVVGLAAFLAEIGVRPVLCASGGKSRRLAQSVGEVTAGILPEPPQVREGVDFYEIAEEAESLGPDFIVGHSKGYHLARKREIPLLRVGFPIHDRFGGQRLLHVGYRGAQGLYDTLVNTLLEAKQESSRVGYAYL
jgi:nitrogenase molybdenum-iron protein NifN